MFFLTNFLKLITYPIIAWLSYCLVKNDYQRYEYSLKYRGRPVGKLMFRHSTLIFRLIALHCLTYGRYMYGDIGVYNVRFGAGLGWEESPGLDFVFTLLHKFTNDIDWLVIILSAWPSLTAQGNAYLRSVSLSL